MLTPDDFRIILLSFPKLHCSFLLELHYKLIREWMTLTKLFLSSTHIISCLYDEGVSIYLLV